MYNVYFDNHIHIYLIIKAQLKPKKGYCLKLLLLLLSANKKKKILYKP